MGVKCRDWFSTGATGATGGGVTGITGPTGPTGATGQSELPVPFIDTTILPVGLTGTAGAIDDFLRPFINATNNGCVTLLPTNDAQLISTPTDFGFDIDHPTPTTFTIDTTGIYFVGYGFSIGTIISQAFTSTISINGTAIAGSPLISDFTNLNFHSVHASTVLSLNAGDVVEFSVTFPGTAASQTTLCWPTIYMYEIAETRLMKTMNRN